MWIDKLTNGVLQVDTLIGPRFIRPDLFERAYLLWIFRNFESLPQQVLSVRQQRLIDRLCGEQVFVPMGLDRPVIGIIEKRVPPQPEGLPFRKTGSSTLAEREREAASA